MAVSNQTLYKEAGRYHDNELAGLRAVEDAIGSDSFLKVLMGLLILAPRRNENCSLTRTQYTARESHNIGNTVTPMPLYR